MCAAGGWLLAVFACSLALPSPAPPLSATARRLRRAAAGPCSLSLSLARRGTHDASKHASMAPHYRPAARGGGGQSQSERASDPPPVTHPQTPDAPAGCPTDAYRLPLHNARASPRPAATTPRLRPAKPPRTQSTQNATHHVNPFGGNIRVDAFSQCIKSNQIIVISI